MATHQERKPAADQAALLKAISHPLRLRILQEINRGYASPKDVADSLGESLGVVSYHVRTLEELGCIELAETKFRRGAVQHFYKPLRRLELSDSEWAALPESVRGSISATTLDSVIELAAAALKDGSFEARADRHLSWLELRLDEAGWNEVNVMLKDVLDRAMELQERTPRQDATVTSIMAMVHFQHNP